MFKHLEVWIKTNKVDRIIIDFDLQTDMFTDALQSLDYFKKMDFSRLRHFLSINPRI